MKFLSKIALEMMYGGFGDAAREGISYLWNKYQRTWYDPNQALPKAINESITQTWDVMKLAVAEDSYFQRLKQHLQKGEIKTLLEPIKYFLREKDTDFRKRCLEQLLILEEREIPDLTLPSSTLSNESDSLKHSLLPSIYCDSTQLIDHANDCMIGISIQVKQEEHIELAELMQVQPYNRLPLVLETFTYLLNARLFEQSELRDLLLSSQIQQLKNKHVQLFVELGEVINHNKEELLGGVYGALDKFGNQFHGRFDRIEQQIASALKTPSLISDDTKHVTHIASFEISFMNSPRKLMFRLIKPTSFTLGSSTSETGRDKDEGPWHNITSNLFYISETPVTQSQWKALMNDIPEQPVEGDDVPVTNVSWKEVSQYVQKLNDNYHIFKLEIDGEFSLPTEIQWEYACRAGSTNEYFWRGDSSARNKYLWYEKNSNGQPQPVAKKQSNDFGLYDVLGNVWEWCNDIYGSVSIGTKSPNNLNPFFVIRGGAWNSPASDVRCARRFCQPQSYRDPSIGFRVVLNPRN